MRHAIPPGGPEATARALDAVGAARTVVLVEGLSDQIALETRAACTGLNLAVDGVGVVPIGGAQAIARFLAQFRAEAPHVRLAGLCDAAEANVFGRALERAGFGADLTRDELEQLGFFVCVEDLEDELIRALGPARVEAVLDAHDDLAPFRTFQKQPAWRDQSIDSQLHRFLRSSDRRSLRYARLLVEALGPGASVRPLDALLAYTRTR